MRSLIRISKGSGFSTIQDPIIHPGVLCVCMCTNAFDHGHSFFFFGKMLMFTVIIKRYIS